MLGNTGHEVGTVGLDAYRDGVLLEQLGTPGLLPCLERGGLWWSRVKRGM